MQPQALLAKAIKALRTRKYRWHVDIFNGTAVRGWVYKRRAPGEPSLVAVFRNGEAISAPTMTVHRDDLAGIGLGPVAFTVNLTCASTDAVELRVADPRCPDKWMVLERSMRRPVGLGAVDNVTGSTIRGWAASFAPGARHCTVLVCRGSETVARTRTSFLRPDAADAIAFHDARIGFETSICWRYSAFENLTVSGEANGKRFVIAELTPNLADNKAFTQSFHYSADSRFWA